jgi:hypothetical protein
VNRYRNRCFRVEKLFCFLFLLITFVVACEIIISPYSQVAKLEGFFPALKIGPYTATLSELLVPVFTAIFLFLVFAQRALYPQKFSFALSPYKGMNILIVIFLFNVILATGFGLLLKNEDSIAMFRVLISLSSFFVLYYYRSVVFSYNKFILGLINLIGFTVAVLAITTFFYPEIKLPTFYLNEMYIEALWYALYFTVFTATYHFNKIVFSGFSVYSLVVFLTSLVAFILRINNKPIILATFVAITVTAMIMFFIYKKGVFKAVFILVCFIILSSVVFSSPEIRGEFFSTVAHRFYKIEIDSGIMSSFSFYDVLALTHDVEIGGTRDVTGGRFDLWLGYLEKGLEYPIVTPYFGTKPHIYISAASQEVDFAAHNSIIQYIYHAGFPAGIALFLLAILFIIKGWRYLKNDIKYSTLKPYQVNALYSFIVAIIAVEMVGGPIQSSVTFSWFFWLMVTIFFHQIFLSKTYMQYLKVFRS